MGLRLVLFYILALTVVLAVVPWMEVGARTFARSPFVTVFAQSGIPQAAGVMNFVVITAALSSMNTNIYLGSRMLFSLSRGGYAPGLLGRLNAAGAPIPAIMLSGAGILACAAVSWLTPKAYSYLFGIALFGAITVWIMILVSHIAFRRRHEAARLTVRSPGYPYMQIAGIVLLSAVLVTMGLDRDWNLSWIVGVPWLGLLSLAYLIARRRSLGKTTV
jgi:L-asparagine transporter-like permease